MFDKLIDLLVQSIQLFQIYHFIPAYERGVVLRFGKFHRNAEPGWIWVWPLKLERVITTNVQPEPLMVGPQSLTTADGKRIVISAMFIIVVEDPRKFLLELEGGNSAILTIGAGALARFVESRKLEEIYCRDAEERQVSPSKKLATAMRNKIKDFGAAVLDAQISDLCETRSLRLFSK